MLTANLIKEDLSIAYLVAVSSRNGFATEIRKRDSDGIDIEIVNKGKPDPACTRIEGRIAVQLKATSSAWAENDDGTISYPLAIKAYNDLRHANEELIVPRILILLCLEYDEGNWVTVDMDKLAIRKCAFWMSLENYPDEQNTSSVTIRIPNRNLLTPEALKAMMIRIQKQEEL